MSYSIGPVRGATKQAALDALAAKFDETVLRTQPDHAHDRGAALAVAETMAALVPDPSPEQDVELYLNGSLGWTDSAGPVRVYHSAGVGAAAHLVPKQPAA